MWLEQIGVNRRQPRVVAGRYGGVLALIVLFLVRVVHFSAAAVGFLVAVGSVGGVLGSLAVRPIGERIGTARTLLLSVGVSGLSGLLIPLAMVNLRVVLFIIGSALVSAGITAANIIMVSFRQKYTPKGMLGRSSATQRFLIFGTSPLGALLAGALGSAVGIRAALWILLVAFALSGTLLLRRSILGSADLPSAPPAALGDPTGYPGN